MKLGWKRQRTIQKIVEYKLMLSDKVVNGDLLRFYTPENFTPIDRTQYNYNLSPDGEESRIKNKHKLLRGKSSGSFFKLHFELICWKIYVG